MSATTAVKPRRQISVKAATGHVRKNLIRKPKSDGASEYAGLALDSLENFKKDVVSHLADVSNLSTSTLDVADYIELLDEARKLEAWTPSRVRKARKTSPASPAKAALVNVHITASRSVPAPRSSRTPVTVQVSVPPVELTPALARKAKAQAAAEKMTVTPTKINKVVPDNWLYMAEHANTASARAWWKGHCDRRARGEV